MRSFFRRLSMALVGLSVFVWLLPVQAAPVTEIFFKLAPPQEIQVGQIFDVQMLIKAPEDINAVQGRVSVSSDTLAIKEIRDGNSVINFWVERPHETAGGIAFAGIVPGGYQAKQGLLFTVRFQATKEGPATLQLLDAVVLKNDGLGTQAPLAVQPFSFSVVAAKGLVPALPATADKEPPEAFQPVIAKDPNIFDEKWFVTFATQDKGSGIDYYQIEEGTSAWRKAESPYLLSDQSLSQRVFVKAIDRSGNERVEMIEPLHPAAPSYLLWVLFGILGIVTALFYMSKRRRPKSKRSSV